MNPDVSAEGLENWHIECKRVEKLNVSQAYAQARQDCGGLSEPIVIHRKNREKWLVTFSLDAWLALIGGVKGEQQSDSQALQTG